MTISFVVGALATKKGKEGKKRRVTLGARSHPSCRKEKQNEATASEKRKGIKGI